MSLGGMGFLLGLGSVDSQPWRCKTFHLDPRACQDDPQAGSSGTIVRDVNNKGDATGAYFDSNNHEVGFRLHGGKYYDLKDPKANNNTRPDGVNDKLEIVGRYTPTSNANVGFKVITKP